jgi:hypothetical protein
LPVPEAASAAAVTAGHMMLARLDKGTGIRALPAILLTGKLMT